MNWEIKTDKYTINSDGEYIYYNLQGLKIKEIGSTKKQANEFLMINGYQPFEDSYDDFIKAQPQKPRFEIIEDESENEIEDISEPESLGDKFFNSSFSEKSD
ncbi:MAG: hypothetical protein ACMXYK_02635 [Candidatus Woesearchaeota archaeon]